MADKQYVLHISGQGEKWEVRYEYPFAWNVRRKNGQDEPLAAFDLPKSEYRLCDPPERWVDVTDRIDPQFTFDRIHCEQADRNKVAVFAYPGYRLRKVQLETRHKCGKELASIVWAFIVEKREPAP